MDDNLEKLKSLDDYFQNNLSISAHVAWLKSCVDYFMESHQSACLTDLIGFTYNTWLTSDLDEITASGKFGLPSNINQEVSLVLQGKYNLQIIEVLDVSQSPYDQLQKLNGGTSDYLSKSSDTTKEKSSRVLKMKLTDGIRTVSAVEFTPIPEITANTVPGTKIRVTGPVNCFAGVLMLTKDNVIVYGGEVKSLVLKNFQYNVLARLLGKPEVIDDDKLFSYNENDNFNDDMEDMDFLASDEALKILEKEEQEAQLSKMRCDPQTSLSEEQSVPNETNLSDIPVKNIKENVNTILNKVTKLSRTRSSKQRSISEFLSQPSQNMPTTSNTTQAKENNKNSSTEDQMCSSSNSHDTPPYTYISKHLKIVLSTKTTRTIYVKAFIGTLTSKLSINKETNEWNVTVIVNDGTYVIEAEISSSILYNLIGMTPKEAIANKEKKALGVKNCAMALKNLNTVIKLELNPLPKPHKVLTIEDAGKLTELQ